MKEREREREATFKTDLRVRIYYLPPLWQEDIRYSLYLTVVADEAGDVTFWKQGICIN